MYNDTKFLPMTVSLMFITTSAFSQTFNGGDVANEANWTGGLPTDPSNPGTINTDGTFETLTNLYIVQESGEINRSGISQTLSGGSYTLSGGSLNGRLSFIQDGASFIINGGNQTNEQGRDLSVNGAGGSGSSFIITSGSSYIGRDLEVFNGATFTISGGSLDVRDDIGNRNFHGIAEFNFNGGSTTAQFLSFGTASTMRFGGTTAGTVTVDNFGGARHNVDNIRIDFLAGSLMALELTNPVESGNLNDGSLGWSNTRSETGLVWAEALWADGRLTYGGQGFDTYGDWGDVNGSIFNFQGSELSLVPETTSFALLSGLLTFSWIMFRHRTQLQQKTH